MTSEAPPTPVELQVYQAMADRILAKDSQTMFLLRSKLYEHYFLNNPAQKRLYQDQAIQQAQAYLKDNREKAIKMAADIGFGNGGNLVNGLSEWVQKMATAQSHSQPSVSGGSAQVTACGDCKRFYLVVGAVLVTAVIFLVIWQRLKK